MMKWIVLALSIVSTQVCAQEATVTLTESELRAVVSAQVAQALAQQEAQKAQAVMQKVQQAFAPKQAEPSKK